MGEDRIKPGDRVIFIPEEGGSSAKALEGTSLGIGERHYNAFGSYDTTHVIDDEGKIHRNVTAVRKEGETAHS